MLSKLAVFVLALLLQVAGCKWPHDAKPPQPRLVMLNVFCTLRKDMLEPYDGSIEYTPNLKRFAEQGLVLERHVTEAGQSGVAFASIMSGDHAMRHLVYSHPTRLTDAIQTLPEAFAEAGYDTFFWERQSMASVALNYGQGVPQDQAFSRHRLKENDPRFQAVDDYGLAGKSLIAFTADHGEELYRENSLFKWSHSFDLAPDVINVPFIVRGSGIEPGRYTGISSSADVFPTLAALAQVPIEEGQATFGSNLLARSPTSCTRPPQKIVFSHTGLWPPVGGRWWTQQPHLLKFHPRYDPASVWVSARSNDLVIEYRYDGAGKFVYEAFDLAADPKAARNIFDAEHARHRELVEQLDRYRKILIDAHVDPRKKVPDGSQPDEATLIEQLRALGYID